MFLPFSTFVIFSIFSIFFILFFSYDIYVMSVTANISYPNQNHFALCIFCTLVVIILSFIRGKNKGRSKVLVYIDTICVCFYGHRFCCFCLSTYIWCFLFCSCFVHFAWDKFSIQVRKKEK